MKRIKLTIPTLNKLFGDNVRFYRTSMNWSQEHLAELISVSKNTIHEIETGRKFVRAERLVQLSGVFDIDVYKLFLPKNIQNVDSPRVIARFADQVRESLEIIKGDFIRNGLPQ